MVKRGKAEITNPGMEPQRCWHLCLLKGDSSMPDREVRTLQDLIWYQYAKIIAKRALGPEAKRVIELLKETRSAFIRTAITGRIEALGGIA
jgi:hypothetical protein